MLAMRKWVIYTMQMDAMREIVGIFQHDLHNIPLLNPNHGEGNRSNGLALTLSKFSVDMPLVFGANTQAPGCIPEQCQMLAEPLENRVTYHSIP
jgi:hypothetical protein